MIFNGKKVNPDDYVTKNFKYGEFQSKDGDPKVIMSTKTLELLQKLRDHIGAIRINSAYRSPNHNKRVGGAKNSQHVKGTALDIVSLEGYNPTDVARFAYTLGFDGIGIYNTFTHVDTRGYKARWGKNTTFTKKALPPIKSTRRKSEMRDITVKKGKKKAVVKVYVEYDKDNNATQYLKIRDLEKLGFTVGWDNKEKVVTIDD